MSNQLGTNTSLFMLSTALVEHEAAQARRHQGMLTWSFQSLAMA